MSVTVSAATFNAALNGLFEDKSYVVGVEASAADAEIFKLLGSKPDAKAFPHLARWYTHIASLGDAISGLKAAEAPAAEAAGDEDDEMDLFGSDEEEDAEAEKVKQQRLAEYRAKKAAKGPGPAAKSQFVMDIKVWDAETDLDELAQMVLAIEMDGLVWNKNIQKLPVAYGVNKLRIACVIEDDKIMTDELAEKIEAFEDYVQSVDTESLTKI
ncbi:Translation elongation factor 1 beta [Coemansia javaensis]|uniref:Translation elongation factor 1 beta n=1 Tax=Coemansia javaensis TaxID=2761396 RepID=A0A9W8HHC1_9FUNG|nr:Translation elongation factor 1 beta [Coemansia javaensis]